MIIRTPLEDSTTNTPCNLIAPKDVEIFERWFNQIDVIVRSQLSTYSISRADKEDLYQEVMLKLFLVLPSFDFSKSQPITHYVSKVVKSVRNDYFRRQRRQQQRQHSLVLECEAQYQDFKQFNPVMDVMILRNNKEELVLLIGKLSPLERTIITFIMHDYSSSEIASILGKDVKTVYNAVQRSKLKLKRALKSKALK
ncbi:RNA polymerase sigma factor [Staphylococcus sp. SQ8-PEA]|uniref:RNA polymerase sigma factor n=1 Tax=Staphylococcus marylandisciuri TaxID=2981529 RepID=A0ABT2QRU1_9STAP|nr:RNA polymerase sigma factor [Staphylococcus marylandisciuri]MCU5746692.1 RNA polymerase sigma factor [Staphylococcus marylandisciuri]